VSLISRLESNKEEEDEPFSCTTSSHLRVKESEWESRRVGEWESERVREWESERVSEKERECVIGERPPATFSCGARTTQRLTQLFL